MIAWKYSQIVDLVHDVLNISVSITLWYVWISLCLSFRDKLSSKTNEHQCQKHDLKRKKKIQILLACS